MHFYLEGIYWIQVYRSVPIYYTLGNDIPQFSEEIDLPQSSPCKIKEHFIV